MLMVLVILCQHLLKFKESGGGGWGVPGYQEVCISQPSKYLANCIPSD